MANILKQFRQWKTVKTGKPFTQKMLSEYTRKYSDRGYSLRYIQSMEQEIKPIARGLELWLREVMKKK